MVEKDIELNEREITEMEEEFVNLEKLHADDDAEGARYLSSFRPLSLSPNTFSSVSVLLCLNSLMDICIVCLQRNSLSQEYT